MSDEQQVAEQEPKAYENTKSKVVGAIRIVPGQPPKGIAVKPGEVVWLGPDERKATANAPKSNADNPFANGTFRRVREDRAADATRPTDEVEQPTPVEAPPPTSTVVDEEAGADERPPGTEPESEPERQPAQDGDPAPAQPPEEDVQATAAAKAEAAEKPAAPAPAPPAPAEKLSPDEQAVADAGPDERERIASAVAASPEK